jgi:spore maturation protein CgeB
VRFVVLGLSITSAWGNGHASTYRSLLRALAGRGHDVLFLERDAPCYAPHRDSPGVPWARVRLYRTRADLQRRYGADIAQADVVMLGSYVPEGADIADYLLRQAEGVRAFYDIDTPVTLQTIARGRAEYIRRAQIPKFDLYLSSSGGPVIERLERSFGARCARPLYCSVDPQTHAPSAQPERWLLGYLGTYAPDRQPALDSLLVGPARRLSNQRFVVAGSQFPPALEWPPNVDRVDHLPPSDHPRFYGAQRFTLNLTRRPMVEAGYSPSVRLFEAAACGVPIISDPWPGLDAFFTPDREICVARSTREALQFVRDCSERERRAMAHRARLRVLGEHTAEHRAIELEEYVAVCRRRAARASAGARATQNRVLRAPAAGRPTVPEELLVARFLHNPPLEAATARGGAVSEARKEERNHEANDHRRQHRSGLRARGRAPGPDPEPDPDPATSLRTGQQFRERRHGHRVPRT